MLAALQQDMGQDGGPGALYSHSPAPSQEADTHSPMHRSLRLHGLCALEAAVRQGLSRLLCAASLDRWQAAAADAGVSSEAAPSDHLAAIQRLVRASAGGLVGWGVIEDHGHLSEVYGSKV